MRGIIALILMIQFHNFVFTQPNASIPVVKKGHTGDPVLIDVHTASKEKKTLGLSAIADDIEFIPLETAKDCLLDGTLINIVVTSSDIIVFDYQKGYRFNRSGKFLNSIGKKGQGPGEYVRPMRMEVDTINRFIYFADDRKLLKYDYAGNYIETLSLNFGTKIILLAEPGYFAMDDKSYQFAKPNERFSLRFYDVKEKKVISNFPCEHKEKVSGFIIADPVVYKFDNKVFVKDYWSDTIYVMRDYFRAEPYVVIDKGRFRNRSLPNTYYTTGKASSEERTVFEFTRIGESSRFILMLSNQGAVVYDKKEKKTIISDFIPEERLCFVDDLYGGPGFVSHHFPDHLTGDKICTYGSSVKFTLDKNHLINDARYEKYKNMITGKDPEDNQIIMIINLKK